MNEFNPISVLNMATKAVPAVRYAAGVVGIVAAAAIAISFFVSAPAAIIAAIVMLVLMTLLYLFALAGTLGDQAIRLPAILFVYACLLLFVAWSILLTTCVFIQKPLPLPELIGTVLSTPKSSAQPQAAPAEFVFSKPFLSVDQLPASAFAPINVDMASADYVAQLASRPKVVLDGSTLVVGNLSAPAAETLAFSSLELRNGARIITNGSNITVSAKSILSQNGQVLSFDQNALDRPTAPLATPGVNGLGGGVLTIYGELTRDSMLTITLRGQNGGNGGPGRSGLAGAPGNNGQNAADHLFDCARGGGDGGSGRPGGDGEKGARGGKAGNGGDLWLAGAIRNQQAQIVFSAPTGRAGEGGSGGAGGLGGAGGAGGNGSVYCHGGRAGPDGLVGRPGSPGDPGSTGQDGSLKLR